MSTASQRGWPTVYPHLRYAEPEDAIDWLVRVFGFREVARASRPDRLIVSELEGPGGGTVMIAALDDQFRDFIHQRIPEARHRGASVRTPHWTSRPPVAVRPADPTRRPRGLGGGSAVAGWFPWSGQGSM